MAGIITIGDLIGQGFRLSVHCENQFCRHYTELDLDALAERLGPGFATVGSPNPLVAKLRCSACGGKDLGLILSPTTGYTNGPVSHGQDYAKTDPKDRPAVKTRRARRRGPL